jgi:hypothetical protein
LIGRFLVSWFVLVFTVTLKITGAVAASAGNGASEAHSSAALRPSVDGSFGRLIFQFIPPYSY